MLKNQALSREIVDSVVKDVSEATIATMGPNGRLAVIEYSGQPKTTKDGVTVSKSIKYEDKAYDLVSQVITEAAIKTDNECGDGTTTTIFLTQALYDAFKDNLTFPVKRRLNELVEFVIKGLDDFTTHVTVDDPLLRQLALTTSNN